MKGNARKLLALVMALAMLLSVFAAAEDIGQEIDLGGEIVIEGEEGDDTQGEGGEQGLELGEGVDAPDGDLELALGEDLDLDLNDLSLDSLEGEALPPETELAMNAGEGWTDWTSTDSLPNTSGNYKIEGIVTLSSNWSVPKPGETKLRLTDTGRINLGDKWINVAEGATLEIVSESTGTIESNSMFGSAISVGAGGTLKMRGGKIIGTGSTIIGTGVVSIPAGAFTMTGGTIETTAESGCAVDNGNDFTMTGGTIKATGTSGMAVNNSGTFTMTGGEIQVAENGVAVQNTKNFDMSGGTLNATQNNGKGVSNRESNAVFNMSGDAKINANYIGVENGDTSGGSISGGTITMSGGQIIGQRAEGSKGVASFDGTFTMTGGEISNFDSGVSIGGTCNFTMDKTGSDSSGTISGNETGVVTSDGTFNMKAGKIQNNNGVGVYYSGGTFRMSGGSITGNGQYGVNQYAATGKIRLSGQVDISGNTPGDIYLYVYGSNPGNIIIEDALACDKPISVDGDASGLQGHVFTSGFSKTGSKDPAKYFKCNATGYGLYLKDNEVAFGQTATVKFDANGATGTMEDQTVVKGVETELNACAFTWRGHSFDGWNTKADGSGTAYADKAKVPLSANTTLYAVWKQNGVMIDIPAAQEYTGKAIEPKLTTRDTSTGEPLVEGTDYTVRYSDNVRATNEAKAVVTFKGGYASWGSGLVRFVINPKPITVIAEDKTKVEGEADPVLTYICDDLADGDKLEGALAREAGEEPGTYNITQGDLNNTNYKITFVEGKLTITEKKSEPTTVPTTKPTTAPKPEGDIDTEVEKGEDVPEMKVGGLTETVAADLATKEELARVEKGEKLVVFLTATNIDDTVSATDKALVTEAITAVDSDAVVAQYLDFSMYKQVGSDTPTQLTDLKGHKITITITVPNQFRAPAGVKRTFYAVRVHDGKAEIVGSGTGASIKAETDKFSTYALTYVDEVPLEPEPQPEPEPVVPDVALLARMTVAGSSKTALKIAWTKIPGADGYDVYFVKCGREYKSKPKATVTGCSVKVSKLKERTEYKAYVRAWMKVGGKKVYLGDSPELHAITGGYDAKYCNAQSVKLNKSSVTLKVGKTTTVKATVKGVKSGKKLLTHVRKVRYYSSNINVATVNKSGKIKATGIGKCTIWAIANNGVRTSVKVTVK